MQQLKCTCGICRTCYKRIWQEQQRRANGVQPLRATGLDRATYKTEWNRKRRQDPEYRLKEKLNAYRRRV